MGTVVTVIMICVATCGMGMFFQACREEGRAMTGHVVNLFVLSYLALHFAEILAEITRFAEPLQILNYYTFGIFAYLCALAILALPLGVGVVLNTTVQSKPLEVTFRHEGAAAIRRSIFMKRKPRPGTYRRLNHSAHARRT